MAIPPGKFDETTPISTQALDALKPLLSGTAMSPSDVASAFLRAIHQLEQQQNTLIEIVTKNASSISLNAEAVSRLAEASTANSDAVVALASGLKK